MRFQQAELVSAQVWEPFAGSPTKSNSIIGFPKVSASSQGSSKSGPFRSAAKSRLWEDLSLERLSAVTTPFSFNRSRDLLPRFPTDWATAPKQEMHLTSLSKC